MARKNNSGWESGREGVLSSLFRAAEENRALFSQIGRDLLKGSTILALGGLLAYEVPQILTEDGCFSIPFSGDKTLCVAIIKKDARQNVQKDPEAQAGLSSAFKAPNQNTPGFHSNMPRISPEEIMNRLQKKREEKPEYLRL